MRAVLAIAVALGAGCGGDPRPERPNILLLLADDLAPACTGFEGNPHVRTPHLDRLSAAGFFFERAYVPLPQCAPSRVALHTGIAPHRTGVLTNRGARLPAGRPTLASTLRAANYRCGFVGKWHLEDGERPQAGFEDFWRPFVHPRYLDPEVWVDGERQTRVGHAPEVVADLALEFVDAGDEPFLLWASFKAPHAPHDPPPRRAHRVDPGGLALPASVDDDLTDKPVVQRSSAPHRDFLAADTGAILRETAGYYGLVAALDDAIGRILDGLAERGRLDDTLVVFASDNGWLHGQHQMLTKGPALYEELVRVPLILSWPRRIAPGRSGALASTLDLFPTLAAAAGAQTPELDGVSLWPVIDGERVAVRDEVLLTYWQKRPEDDPVPIAGVVTLDHKYARYLNSGEEELYALRDDPLERSNLAASGDPHLAALRTRVDDLARVLQERAAQERGPSPRGD